MRSADLLTDGFARIGAAVHDAVEGLTPEQLAFRVDSDANSIAWGLGTLFTDFEWARWMGQNGRIAAQTAFTWDAVAGQTLRVYQS